MAWTGRRERFAQDSAPSWRWAGAAMLAALGLHACSWLLARGGWDVAWALLPIGAWEVGVHELFHALAAWATGGEVVSIQARAMDGLTTTRGGFYPAISAAGYVGCGFFGAACLRWCARPSMLWAFRAVCAALALALAFKGAAFGGYGWGLAQALTVDALALWGARGRRAPFALALCGCLFLSLGLDDVRMLLLGGADRADAGLLARHLGMPWLAWPIALCYAGAMAALWAWAARGLARDARGG